MLSEAQRPKPRRKHLCPEGPSPGVCSLHAGTGGHPDGLRAGPPARAPASHVHTQRRRGPACCGMGHVWPRSTGFCPHWAMTLSRAETADVCVTYSLQHSPRPLQRRRGPRAPQGRGGAGRETQAGQSRGRSDRPCRRAEPHRGSLGPRVTVPTARAGRQSTSRDRGAPWAWRGGVGGGEEAACRVRGGSDVCAAGQADRGRQRGALAPSGREEGPAALGAGGGRDRKCGASVGGRGALAPGTVPWGRRLLLAPTATGLGGGAQRGGWPVARGGGLGPRRDRDYSRCPRRGSWPI